MGVISTIVGATMVFVGDVLKSYGTRLMFPDGVPEVDETEDETDDESDEDIDAPAPGPSVTLSPEARAAIAVEIAPRVEKEVVKALKGSLRSRLSP